MTDEMDETPKIGCGGDRRSSSYSMISSETKPAQSTLDDSPWGGEEMPYEEWLRVGKPKVGLRNNI